MRSKWNCPLDREQVNENASQGRRARQNLCDVRAPVYLAQEMGTGLGGGALLLGAVSTGKELSAVANCIQCKEVHVFIS